MLPVSMDYYKVPGSSITGNNSCFFKVTYYLNSASNPTSS